MRNLIVLAVIGLTSALPHQAYNSVPITTYGHPNVQTYQPRWTGPLASSVPAGINGKITPVTDTYEVSAARNAFFAAYNKQLDTVNSLRLHRNSPVYEFTSTPNDVHDSAYSYGNSPSAFESAHISTHIHTPNLEIPLSSYSYALPESSESAFNSAPVPTHTSTSKTYFPPSASFHQVPSYDVITHGSVQDTPEVAAAKAEFFRLFNQQAAAASAAPDDDYISYEDDHNGGY